MDKIIIYTEVTINGARYEASRNCIGENNIKNIIESLNKSIEYLLKKHGKLSKQ